MHRHHTQVIIIRFEDGRKHMHGRLSRTPHRLADPAPSLCRALSCNSVIVLPCLALRCPALHPGADPASAQARAEASMHKERQVAAQVGACAGAGAVANLACVFGGVTRAARPALESFAAHPTACAACALRLPCLIVSASQPPPPPACPLRCCAGQAEDAPAGHYCTGREGGKGGKPGGARTCSVVLALQQPAR